MAILRNIQNIKRPRYAVYFRSPATFTVPATAAAFATFLATFTDMGYARDKTIKLEVTPGDKEALDDGKKKSLGFNATIEAVLLQTENADYSGFEAVEGIKQDLLFYDATNHRVIFIPNAVMDFQENTVGGEVESVTMRYEIENAQSKSDIRTRFDEPLV